MLVRIKEDCKNNFIKEKTLDDIINSTFEVDEYDVRNGIAEYDNLKYFKIINNPIYPYTWVLSDYLYEVIDFSKELDKILDI